MTHDMIKGIIGKKYLFFFIHILLTKNIIITTITAIKILIILYSSLMYFIYISTTFFFYTKIEEIKTITTPIIATDNPPIDSLSKPSFFVLFNCSNKRHTRKMTIAIKKFYFSYNLSSVN